ncbi:MAG: histidine kinase [Myxococcota bacterium]
MHRSRLAIAIAVAAAVVSVVSAVEGHFTPWSVVGALVWASLVMIPLTRVGQELEKRSLSVWRSLAILALTAGAASALTEVIFHTFISTFPHAFEGEASNEGLARAALLGFFQGDALFGFWALLVELPRRIARTQRLEIERRSLARESELARIRGALEPHFVLNTLHSVAGLVGDDPGRARELLAALGDLLRYLLKSSSQTYRTVEEEIGWLRSFASIMEMRHGRRLSVHWRVDDSVLKARLPVLLLQPLLENAIHHGALRGGGSVWVNVDRADDWLLVVIVDDGPGFDPDADDGVGLRLTRRRIALESNDATFNVDSSSQGTRATVRLRYIETLEVQKRE